MIKLRSRSYDASIADLRSIHGKIKGHPEGLDVSGDDEGIGVDISRSEMMEDIRIALREGLVSSDKVANEIINDILLNGTNPQDRLRAAELIKKDSESKKGKEVGTPPGEKDIERFCRILTEVGAIRESIEERREISASVAGTVSE